MQVSTEVMNVLEASGFNGNQLRLPPTQLERKLYDAVNKVLEAMGGKWNRSAKAHVFEGDAYEAVEDVLQTGEYTRVKQDLGQFDSPLPVVMRVIQLAGDLSGKWVLEPEAGIGKIAVAAEEMGGIVWAYEIDPRRYAVLKEALEGGDAGAVQCVDFMQVRATSDESALFDVVLMNPPFAKQADIDHVLHAATFLKPGGRLVSVMSASVTYRTNRKAEDFRAWVNAHGGTIEMLPDGAFASSGTQVAACIVSVTL